MDFRARVVDISAWVFGGVDRARTRSATAIDEALTESSVVQITGHGIPPSIIDGLSRSLDALFALDDDAKRALIAPAGLNRGYSARFTESLSASIGLVRDRRDDFEAFNVGAAGGDYPHVRPGGPAYAESIWPQLPDFRRDIENYFNEAGRVTRTLMSVLGDGLGVGRTYFNELTDHSVDTMRLLRYPAGGDMGAHTDYGFTSLAWTREPGLQVAHDREWHDVEPIDGALVVLVGELLSRVTNDRWRPTMHRVVAPGVRTSAMFWHDGNAEATIAPLAGLVPAGEQPLFDPVTVADHITAKLMGSRLGVPYAGAEHALRQLPPED